MECNFVSVKYGRRGVRHDLVPTLLSYFVMWNHDDDNNDGEEDDTRNKDNNEPNIVIIEIDAITAPPQY